MQLFLIQDIRSYFQCQGKTIGSSPKISSGKKTHNEKDKKKKRVLTVSDSDDDNDVAVQSPLKKAKQNGKWPSLALFPYFFISIIVGILPLNLFWGLQESILYFR